LAFFFSNAEFQNLEIQSINVALMARVDFGIQFGVKNNFTYDKSEYATYRKTTSSTTFDIFGGDISLGTDFVAWLPTGIDAPVPMMYNLSPNTELISPAYFPLDKHINEKQKCLSQALQNYYATPLICPNGCSGHGSCVDSGYFNVGTCSCGDQWSGTDCSLSPGWISTGVGSPTPGWPNSQTYMERVGAVCPQGSAIAGIRFQRGGCRETVTWWSQSIVDACPVDQTMDVLNDKIEEGLIAQLLCKPVSSLKASIWRATGTGSPFDSCSQASRFCGFDRVGALCGDNEVATGILFRVGGCTCENNVCSSHQISWPSNVVIDNCTCPCCSNCIGGLTLYLACAAVPEYTGGSWEATGTGSPVSGGHWM